MGDFSQAGALGDFLNELDSTTELVKRVLYNLNRSDNEVFATIAGNFNDGSPKRKVIFWFRLVVFKSKGRYGKTNQYALQYEITKLF